MVWPVLTLAFWFHESRGLFQVRKGSEHNFSLCCALIDSHVQVLVSLRDPVHA